jgi:hypothetical protein
MLKRIFAVCFIALAAALPARATSVLPLNLDEIVSTSAVAFSGTCVGNRTERDVLSDLIVTYTTFAVSDVLKGNAGTTYTIKQVGGTLPDEGTGFRIQGVPSFTVGQEYVVFLAGVSNVGFSSPIGLSQGKFSVLRDAKGATVANGRDFHEMTQNIPNAELPPELATGTKRAGDVMRQLDLDAFKRLVRSRPGVNAVPGVQK